MRDGVDDKDDTSSVWDSPEDSASSDRRRRLSADTFTVEETRAVNIVKSLVYCTLIFTAIGVGLGSYFLIKHEQQKGFQAELEAVSDHAASEIENYLEGISTQLSELAAALSSLYLSSTVTKGWTNLTLPHFNKRIEQKNGVQELIFYSPIVQFDKKKAWENYSVANQGWIDESYINESSIPNQIYSHLNFGYSHTPFYIPVWQVSPIPRNRSIVNMDLFTYPATRKIAMIMISEQKNNTVISETFDAQFLLTFLESDRNQDQTTPRSLLALPVYDDFGPDANGSNVFGYVFALISWEVIFDMVFRDVNAEIIITMKESCGSGFSFNVASGKCIFTRSDNELSTTVLEFKRTIDLFKTCTYSMSIYATRHMESRYVNQLPTLSMALLVLLFGFLVAVFWQYDRLVQQRQSKLLLTAKRTNAVISSLFPEDVQKRIMAEAEEKEQTRDRRALGSITYNKMKEFLEDEKDSGNSNTALLRSKPIADFFPEATIMFADLVGFTAWSSMREPSQVFILLESIYHAFDEVARRRRVFKVETVGDCYVAVAGLPEPCEDHALVMSRFATDCRIKMNNLVKVLEVSLGPDTTDLNMRFGLHSGPVTAGVLRGDRARFQLFGDTVNTTSRLESTGKRDKIHISQETAEYLTKAGKQHWLTLREDKVTAKGKGELTTYWLHVTRPKKRGSSIASQSTKSTYDGSHDHDEIIPLNDIVDQGLNEKQLRLVDWMTNELMELLKDIATRRLTKNVAPEVEENVAKLEILSVKQTRKTTPFQELEEIITLPKFDAASSNLFHEHSPGHFSLPDAVVSELHDFVHSLAVMYQENPFHNFEHASHVTMSVVKLLSRIVAPNITFVGEDVASELHDQTYGITSDPLTQFTVVLSALIHDVDHPGVPNTQLVKEKTTVASVYKNKSVAEQNSVDKTWILLMEGNYANLRKTIYRTEDEFKRFRQLLVNTVLATDIMDEDLGSRRKARWSKAFSEKVEEDAATAVNRKATIVIEHIIQASDIAHSMQHWHIYRKWNGRLFEEMYKVSYVVILAYAAPFLS
jgi:class 3 adenylate cyclase